ncbi:MAG: TatD family hydrolase [Muribaculaceae bacterium]|nr:TatD family hydrolase [Muribaculaceae bacterium]
MIDSHSHIYCDAFDEDREAVIERAREAGVRHIILPNENLASVPRLAAMHERYPDYVSMTLGLHPEDVHDDYLDVLDQMRPMLDEYPVVAIGEIGIDLYWDKTWREQQSHALDIQLHWCHERDLPFIIHCRDGLDDILQVIDHLDCPVPRGVFHSFTGTPDDMKRIRERGDFYFGVNGIVTFKKSTVPELLPVIGLDRLLLETDSPYLSPVPNRGKRNESSNIPHINNFIAKALDVTPTEVSEATDRNVSALFGISPA